MTDIMDKAARSLRMSQIRSTGNKSTELRAAAIFRQYKITGWRRHLPLPGHPDFAFPKSKVAVFIDGCFWHGCPLCNRPPKTRLEYWGPKIEGNKKRDARVTRELKEKGWRVLRVWECELKDPSRLLRSLSRML